MGVGGRDTNQWLQTHVATCGPSVAHCSRHVAATRESNKLTVAQGWVSQPHARVQILSPSIPASFSFHLIRQNKFGRWRLLQKWLSKDICTLMHTQSSSTEWRCSLYLMLKPVSGWSRILWGFYADSLCMFPLKPTISFRAESGHCVAW